MKRIILSFTCVVIFWSSLGCSEDSGEIQSMQEVRLSPQMRIEDDNGILYSIRTDDLVKYIDNLILFDTLDEFERLPYILGFDAQLNMGAEGDIAYATGLLAHDEDSLAYSLLSLGRTYLDPVTRKKIGVEARVVGAADVQQFTTPQMLLITNSLMQIEAGVRLVPKIGLDLPEFLDVRAVKHPVRGYVLSVETTGAGVGSYAVVVINLGHKDGVQQGDLLDLLEHNQKVRDRYTKRDVMLPNSKFGEVVLYKVSAKISLGIIAYTTRPVVISDQVVGHLAS